MKQQHNDIPVTGGLLYECNKCLGRHNFDYVALILDMVGNQV